MSAPTQTAPVATKAVVIPTKGIVEKPIELKDLRRNPEGIVSVNDELIEATQQCTVVSSRLFLGYGGPLAIEDFEGRGLFKALADDIIFELSDGHSYVLPHNLAEALGITAPPPSPLEAAAMAGKLDEYEAEQREKAEKEAAAKAKTAPTPPKPGVTPTPPPPQKLE
jgi:hypothetical protein